MNTPNAQKNTNNMPDPLAPDHEKAELPYGLEVCKAIQGEWFASGKITDKTKFGGRHLWINKMRLSNRGEEDVEDVKKHTSRNKSDLNYLNLDFTPIPISSKYTNVVRNGLSDDFYKVDVRSLDRFSLLMQEDKRLIHLRNMYAKDMLQKAKDIQGIDLRHNGFIPEDEEELNLYMEIKDRPKHEIAEEILIDFVKKTNRWSEIKRTADKDNVECGLMAARIWTDPNNGVMIEDIDIECYGHSYVEKNDFSDAYYHFVVDTITANDIKRESGYNDMQMRDIVKLYGNENGYTDYQDFGTVPIREILDCKIPVMRFAFKSSKEIVFKKYHDKKNNVRKVALRDSTYEVPEGAEQSRIAKRLDTWYEGTYIVGSDKYLYNYQECENLAKDQMNKVIPPFIVQSVDIYKNKLRSFLSDIYQLCKQMQYTLIKIQHLSAELKPDLVEIDIDQLADLNTDIKGQPQTAVWQTALSIMNVKGVIFKKRIDMGEMGIKDGTSTRPVSSQQGSALSALLNVLASQYNLIRETTGINPAMDGMNANDTLVGVNQMMRLAGNTNTKHIADASIAWDKRVCEAISSRIKGVFTAKDKAKHIQKLYEQAVGRHNVEALEALQNRHIHEFGFVLEMVPSKQDLDELRQDLSIALQDGTLDVSDKSEIMRIARSNIKQANEYMRFVRRRNIKERQKEVAQNQQLQTQSNMQSAQAKVQGDIEYYATQKEIDLQFQVKLSAIKLHELQETKDIEAPIEDKKFQQQLYIEQMKNMQTINLKKYDNDEKRNREKEGDTRASKMIEQRQKDKSPIDFKNEFNLFQ